MNKRQWKTNISTKKMVSRWIETLTYLDLKWCISAAGRIGFPAAHPQGPWTTPNGAPVKSAGVTMTTSDESTSNNDLS